MKDFIEETGLAILAIFALIMVLWFAGFLYISLTTEKQCIDHGYINAAVTYNYDTYCQTLTESIRLSEVISNDR